MLLIPAILFWILVFVAKSELGLGWSLFFVVVWAALLVGFMDFGLSAYAFVVAQALLDVILILAIFKGDLPIR